jgi:predicted dehydrogenase
MPHWTAEQHFRQMQDDGVVFSPRLGDGSVLDPWQEAVGTAPVRSRAREASAIERYLGSLPTDYAAMLERLCEPLPAMNPRCRIVVMLPCRNEQHYVSGMLDRLAEQFSFDGGTLSRDQYEVLLLCNTLTGEPRDSTAELARAWRHPSGMALHIVDYLHPADEPCPLTMARKVLADIALIRASRRIQPTPPLYLASEDADVLWIDPHQLALMIAALDGDPGLDGVRGQQDRCPWIMVRHPLLLLMRRSWNFTEAHLARRSLRPDRNPDYDFNWNRVVASGWNTAFTAQVYAEIGGYTRQRRFEEDMDIGEKISCLRAYPVRGGMMPQVNTFGRLTARSDGSPRRWFYRFATGVEPYLDRDDYANFFGLDHEQQVKFRSLDDFESALAPVTALRPENIEILRPLLQKDLDFLVMARQDPRRGQHDYGRILRWVGFAPGAVTLSQGQIEIHSLAGLQDRLDAWVYRYPDRPVAAVLQVGSRFRRSWHALGRGRPEFAAGKGRSYRVGLIGCGRVVEEGHATVYRALPVSMKIVSLFDPGPERRRSVGALLAIDPGHQYSSLQAMLAGESLDAVVVASPSARHADTVRRCLEHGLAVLCEKPLAIDAAAARSLSELAQGQGLPLGTIHNYVSMPLWQRGLELLRLGGLGAPLRFHTRIAAPEALPGYSTGDPMWRQRRDTAGRGCLLDQGYHLFYLSLEIFGTPIVALDGNMSSSDVPGRDVDDRAAVILRHACGGETSFSIDWRSSAVEPTVYVIECANGRLRLDEDTGRVEIEVAGAGTRVETVSRDDVYGYRGSLGESLRRMSAGEDLVTSALRGIDVLTWIDEAYRLAATPASKI